jgi:Nitroreductase
MKTRYMENCISCGHCVAVCPENSITHSSFPVGTIHAIDKSVLPTADSVEMLIKSRRSNRAFSSKEIPEEYLERIIEAAYRCPTASNEQELEFTVVTNPDKLRLISRYTLDTFASLVNTLSPIKPLVRPFVKNADNLIAQFRMMESEFERGNDLILRKANAVILIHAHPKARFGMQDANLAYQNASLMAESLGVAHFYTGFVYEANRMDRKKRLNKALGIEGKIQAGMALGMPSFEFDNYIDRKPIRLRRV